MAELRALLLQHYRAEFDPVGLDAHLARWEAGALPIAPEDVEDVAFAPFLLLAAYSESTGTQRVTTDYSELVARTDTAFRCGGYDPVRWLASCVHASYAGQTHASIPGWVGEWYDRLFTQGA